MLVYFFLAAAALAVVFALVAILHRNPVINVLALVVMFFAMAAIFAMLGMDFLAAIQIIVYAGAILVLFLFVVMLLKVGPAERFGSGRPLQALLGALAAIGLGGTLVYAASRLAPVYGSNIAGAEQGTVFPFARVLLGPHLFSFELISVLLVAAIVGAVYLARREQP